MTERISSPSEAATPAQSAIQEQMTYDPRKTVDHPGTDPDKGMKTRPYLKFLLAAIVVLLVAALVIARLGSKSGPPVKPATTSSGTSNPSPQ